MKRGDKILTFKNIIFSDPDFFDIFTFPALRGNPREALARPMGLVLTESEARRIFGNEDPIDKVVKMENAFDLTVMAVIKDVPQNSSMQFSGIISFISIAKMTGEPENRIWLDDNYETYVLFPARSDKTRLSKEIESTIDRNIPTNVKAVSNLNTDLYPFKDVYYEQDLSSFNSHGSWEKNFALISIAILVLLIALINYVNLSTARVSTRNKEVGVRKTIGASRHDIMAQFLSESILLTVVSMIVATLVAMVLLESFGNLLDFHLSLFPDSVLLRCAVLLFASIFVGVLAGIYPAFYLTSFKPDSILKGNIHHGSGRSSLRRALIVFQFSITIVLIISTIVIYEQMEFVRDKPLGFQKENIIYFPVSGEIQPKQGVFAARIRQLSSVKDFAYSFAVPGSMGMMWGMPLNYQGRESQVNFYAVPTSGEFIHLMEMKILEGRNFMDDTSDVGNVIINQAFAEKFGIENPMDAKVGGIRLGALGKSQSTVVGVVKDFNFQSLHSKVEPLVFYNFPGWSNYGVVETNSNSYANIKSVISNLKSVWKELSPDFPFEYNFLNQSLAMQYKAEEEFEEVFLCFSLFAVFIASLGLFGLTAYTVEQRTKEICIRKILGATVTGLTFMLSKQFIMLVLISNVIAWPVAYYVMNNWLKDFAYRININPWIFLVSGAMALAIALLTVSSHAVKAATANPVESLRYE
jgi:putative ABC transport system permease protein